MLNKDVEEGTNKIFTARAYGICIWRGCNGWMWSVWLRREPWRFGDSWNIKPGGCLDGVRFSFGYLVNSSREGGFWFPSAPYF